MLPISDPNSTETSLSCQDAFEAAVAEIRRFLSVCSLGSNSALNHDTLRHQAFKPYVRGWSERDSSAMES